MSEVRKIITENVRAAELPERFRAGIEPGKVVTVVVTEKNEPVRAPGEEAKYLKYWGVAAHRNTSIEEAVARVRELRDEWEDR